MVLMRRSRDRRSRAQLALRERLATIARVITNDRTKVVAPRINAPSSALPMVAPPMNAIAW